MRRRLVLLCAIAACCLGALNPAARAAANEFPSAGGSGATASGSRVAGDQIVPGTSGAPASGATGGEAASSADGAATPGNLASTGTSAVEMAGAALVLVAVGTLLAATPRHLARRRLGPVGSPPG